jgi:glycosyltransferase involved in cell wall biosynthesis
MAKKSVVLLGPSLDAVSGVSTHIRQLLSSDLAGEFELRHFQVGSEGRRESALARVGRLIFGPVALAIYLLRTRPGIVHLNTSINPRAFWRDLGYLLVARALRRKTVYQVHGGKPPQEFAGNRPLRLALMRWVLKLPQAIVLLARSEVSAYREFVPGERLELIPNAIALVEPQSMAPRMNNEAPLHLAYVGRLIREKGLFEILAAIGILHKRGIAVDLVVAGAGPDAAAMQNMVSQLGLSRQVKFVGSVFAEEKSRLWASADVFAFPTFHRERLPYALLESMAAGVVPITSAVGAIPDVMEDGVHGILVPSRDPQALVAAIERLHGDRAMLQRMARACQQRIRERFTVERMAHEFRTLYETL